MQRKSTRRQVLAGTAGMAAATMAGSAIADVQAPTLDAEILDLGREFDAAWTAERRWFAEVYPKLPVAGQDDAANVQIDIADAIVRRIIATPATTIEGLQVKARALLWCHGGDDDPIGLARDLMAESPATDAKLKWSIVGDLFASAGKSAEAPDV